MKLSIFSIAIAVVVATTVTGSAQSPRGKDLEKPLVIAKQGSFFVGGEKKALPAPPPGGRGGAPAGGEITVNQMYVQYQVPPDRKSTRLNSSHLGISYAVFCLKKKNNKKKHSR